MTRRARLSVEKDGPILRLSDEKGTSRAGLIENKDRGPSFYLYDEKGTARAWF